MMRCTITSPITSAVFEGLSAIRVFTTTGAREILPGHIALIAGLAPDSSVELVPADGSTPLHIGVAAGSFFQFEQDDALILTPSMTNG